MYQENLKEINLEPRWTTKVTTKRWQLAIVSSDTCSNYSLCGEINVSETLETILATCLSIRWRVEESAFPMWTKKQLSRPQHKFCAFASPFFCSFYRVCLQVHLWAWASTLSLWRLETSWHQQFRLGSGWIYQKHDLSQTWCNKVIICFFDPSLIYLCNTTVHDLNYASSRMYQDLLLLHTLFFKYLLVPSDLLQTSAVPTASKEHPS